MKDIQEIMKEMEHLGNQLAVTLTEDVQQPQQVECIDCSGTAGAVACGDLPAPSRLVTFTTRISAPQGFAFATGTGALNPRILYDLNCLSCFVEQCICSNTLVRYAVRIVGSIPYILNVRINPSTNQCLNDGNVFLCYHDSICVNNTICFGCSEVQSLVSCALIGQNFNCASIPVTLTATFNADATVATIIGTFTLPSCNPTA